MAIWLLFLLTAVVRKVLTLNREPIVTAQVVATRLGITGQLHVAILIGLILGRAQRRS